MHRSPRLPPAWRGQAVEVSAAKPVHRRPLEGLQDAAASARDRVRDAVDGGSGTDGSGDRRHGSHERHPRRDGPLGALIGRLPEPVAGLIDDLRGLDVFLYSAGLAFYALISIAPTVIVAMWVAGAALGDQRVQELGAELKRLAPSDLGIDDALRRVATQGTALGLPAVVTAIWPATAYGSGLTRAFDSLTRRDHRMPGIRGRVVAMLVLLPVVTVGTLVAVFLGTSVFGTEGWSRLFGWAVGLLAGSAALFVGTALMLWIIPPARPSPRGIAVGSAATAVGSSVLAVVILAVLSAGSNFKEHYATSALAGIVLIGLWLYLSNALLLASYRAAQDL